MTETDPRGKTRNVPDRIEDIQVSSAVRVVAHGGRFYLSVHARDIEFWGLKTSDEVLMTLSKVKRYNPLSRKEGKDD